MSFTRSLSCLESVFSKDYCASGFYESKGCWNPSGNRGRDDEARPVEGVGCAVVVLVLWART